MPHPPPAKCSGTERVVAHIRLIRNDEVDGEFFCSAGEHVVRALFPRRRAKNTSRLRRAMRKVATEVGLCLT